MSKPIYNKGTKPKRTNQDKQPVQNNEAVYRRNLKSSFLFDLKGHNFNISKEEDSESCSCDSCQCELCIAESNSIRVNDPHLFFQSNVANQISSKTSRPNSSGINNNFFKTFFNFKKLFKTYLTILYRNLKSYYFVFTFRIW